MARPRALPRTIVGLTVLPVGPKLDYVAQALSRLLQQYKGKPVTAGILTAIENRLQELERAAWEVILFTLLPNAEGAQLAQIARIVGVETGTTLTDAQLRREIAVAILLLRDQGTPNEIEKIGALAFPDGVGFTYGDERIATIRITALAAMSYADATQVFRILSAARQGGVRLLFTYVREVGVDMDHTLTCKEYGLGSTFTKGFHSYGVADSNGYIRGMLSTS